MMKINYFVVTLVLIGPFVLHAQKDETHFIKDAKENFYSFEYFHYLRGPKLPFKKIIVIDKRFDTTKIGYTHDKISNKFSKIVLQKNWSEILNEYFRNNLDTNSQQNLVIVIQTFWLQFGMPVGVRRQKNINEVYKDDIDRGGSIITELNVFVQSDSSFQAFFKIDGIILSLRSYSKNKIDNFFFLPFDSVAKKINSLSVSQAVLNKRKIKLDEIHTVYNNRFQIPVLNQITPEKGVFLSFQEFKENKPRYTQFGLKKGDLTDEVYIVNNGKEEILENYWGFFDNAGLYIRLGLNVFKAIRQQNTYELVGFHNTNTYYDYQTGIAFTRKSRKIFQVNMRTGKLY